MVRQHRILPKCIDSGDKLPGFDPGSPSWLFLKIIYLISPCFGFFTCKIKTERVPNS